MDAVVSRLNTWYILKQWTGYFCVYVKRNSVLGSGHLKQLFRLQGHPEGRSGFVQMHDELLGAVGCGDQARNLPRRRGGGAQGQAGSESREKQQLTKVPQPESGKVGAYTERCWDRGSTFSSSVISGPFRPPLGQHCLSPRTRWTDSVSDFPLNQRRPTGPSINRRLAGLVPCPDPLP